MPLKTEFQLRQLAPFSAAQMLFANYAEKLRKAVNHTSTTQTDCAISAKLNGGKKSADEIRERERCVAG